MKLSCSIMAHCKRKDFVTELQESLDREVAVAWDKHQKPSKDPERRWATGKHAWQLGLEADADWHLVLQDDALVVPDLLAGLEKGLEHVTQYAVVQPHIGAKKPYPGRVSRLISKGDRQQASWLVSDFMMWGIGICLPTHSIEAMLEGCDKQRGRAYDRRIGNYYRDEAKWPVWYTWPSLVEHRTCDSLCGHGPVNRNAHRMFQRSALQFPFDGNVVR